MSIDEWLNVFCSSWIKQDVDAVMRLFTDGVDYWETPFVQYDSVETVRKGWEVVKTQQNINIQARRAVSEGNTHTVQWELHYERDASHFTWAGLYLIRINEMGLCDYFYQVGEAAK
jgi:hypothetical protein